MLTTSEYLETHGLKRDGLRDLFRLLAPGETLMLVGSVAEGLATRDSDLDLLVLKQGRDEVTSAGDDVDNTLQRLPQGCDLNIELWAVTRAESLCRRFSEMLDLARGEQVTVGDRRQLPFLAPDELRLLHRLRTGVPIGPSESLEELRRRHRLHALPELCLVQHVACHLGLRADAVSAASNGDAHTTALMCHLATQRLVLAMLAHVGETNNSDKWVLRLLQDHRDQLVGFEVDTALELALPHAPLATEALVARMIELSEATLERLVATQGPHGDKLARSLHDLRPPQPQAESQSGDEHDHVA